jgi:hypothetical protein
MAAVQTCNYIVIYVVVHSAMAILVYKKVRFEVRAFVK